MASLADLAGAQEAVRRGYRQYLGREASDAELRGQLGNYAPGQYEARNVQHSLAQLQGSPEARLWAASQQPAAGTPPAAGGTTPPAAGGTTPTTPPPTATNLPANAPDWLRNAPPATHRFTPGGYGYTGFNFERDQNVGRSAKDAFAYATSLGERAGAGNMWQTKSGAQQFAELYIRPYLESQGYKVQGINGDLINIVTREDEQAGNTAGSWFDFVVNADGASMGLTPQLAWQIQSGTGAQGPATGPPGSGIAAGAPPTTPTTPTTPTSAASPISGLRPEVYQLLVDQGKVAAAPNWTRVQATTWEELTPEEKQRLINLGVAIPGSNANLAGLAPPTSGGAGPPVMV